MSKVAVTANVNAPSQRVLEVISNFGNVHAFHPMVDRGDMLNGKDRGFRAKRRCNFYDNTSVVEEITEWIDGIEITIIGRSRKNQGGKTMFEQKTRGNLIEKISSNVKIVKPKSISLSNWCGKALLAALVGLVMIGASLNVEAYYGHGYHSGYGYRSGHGYHSGYPYHYGRIYSGYGYYPIYSDGSDPFIESVEDGDIVAVRSFVKNGANVNAKDYDGENVLSLAADEGHTAVARILLDKGANINAKDDDGETALMIAADEGHTAVARILLDKGANINAKNDDGETALMIAADEGHTQVVRILLDKGANINAKNDDGETALMIAADEGHTVIAQLLRDAGATE